MKLPLPWGFVVEGLICSAPSGCLHHWRAWRPSLLRFASSGTIDWRFLGYPCSLGRCSSPGDLPGILNRSAPSALICTGCVRHCLCRTIASIAVRLITASMLSPVIWSHLFAGASMARLLYFRLSDRMRRSYVLLNSHLLLFDGQLSLVLSLLSVVWEEWIIV